MNSMRSAALLILVAASTAGQAMPAQPPSFSAQIVPLLNRRCVACHMTGAEPGRLALTPKRAFESLVGAPSTEAKLLRVQPGKPQASYLLHKLKGTHRTAGGTGERMPFGMPPLDAAAIGKVEAWIVAGARKD